MTDVVIVGAGPSGLAAAAVCGGHGLSTSLLDDQPTPGGQIWRSAEAVADRPLPALAKTYKGARAAIDAARKSVTLHRSAHVLDVSADRTVLWLDRSNGTPRLTETPAKALILATGAAERPVPFPGWTLPGVMGAGALQVALKQGGLVPGGPIVLAGQGPLLLLVLDQLSSVGANVVAVLDFAVGGAAGAAKPLLNAALADRTLLAEGARLLMSRKRSGVPVVRGVKALRAVGGNILEAVEVEDGKGRHHRFEATTLAVHDGVIANTQLTRLMNLPHSWRESDAAFAPDVGPTFRAVEGVWVVGDGAGIGGAALASLRGEIAGLQVVAELTGKNTEHPLQAATARAQRLAKARPLVETLYPARPVSAFAEDDTVLCRCEGVTFGAVRAAVSSGATGPNRVKAFTRCGMGPCQGRMCANPLTRLMAEAMKTPPQAVGALRIRPPLKPILVGDYLTLDADTP